MTPFQVWCQRWCSEFGANGDLFRTAAEVFEGLTDAQVSAFYLCIVQSEDPESLPFWDEIEPLYLPDSAPPTMTVEIFRVVCGYGVYRLATLVP